MMSTPSPIRRPYYPPSLSRDVASMRRHRNIRPYRPPSLFDEDNTHFVPRVVRQLNFDECCVKIEKSLSLLPCNEDENNECSICMSTQDELSSMGRLHCGHTFHNHCIKTWFLMSKNTCPYCRSEIDVNSLM